MMMVVVMMMLMMMMIIPRPPPPPPRAVSCARASECMLCVDFEGVRVRVCARARVRVHACACTHPRACTLFLRFDGLRRALRGTHALRFILS